LCKMEYITVAIVTAGGTYLLCGDEMLRLDGAETSYSLGL